MTEKMTFMDFSGISGISWQNQVTMKTFSRKSARKRKSTEKMTFTDLFCIPATLFEEVPLPSSRFWPKDAKR